MNLVFVQFPNLPKSITEGKKNMNNKPLSCSIAISNSCSNANAKWLDDVVMSALAGFFSEKSSFISQN